MRALLAFHPVEGGACFVDYICVDRQHRKSGLGRAMLCNISTPIYLITACLRPCSAFYARCGFSECASSPYLPGFAEQSLHAPAMEGERIGRATTWTALSAAEQVDAVAIVRRTERTGEAAARQLLGVGDRRVLLIIVD